MTWRDPSLCYDKGGQPISIEEWSRLKFLVPGYFRVAETDVGPYWVSTVWLGFDHSFGGPVPLIFETMVFGEDGTAMNDYTDRYPTEATAKEGHRQVADLVRWDLEHSEVSNGRADQT
jgi:hypothetical protein